MIDAIVVGAGHAGLAMSHHLTRRGIEHLVLERGAVGESWSSLRWDSFALNTPGWFSRLPGAAPAADAGPADGFWTRDGFVGYLCAYAERERLPVRTGVTVTEVKPGSRGDLVVRTDATEPIRAATVVFAAGSQRVPRIPAFARSLPSWLTQLHLGAYRRPADLPSGGVLVVGSAQSGAQIAEDLLDAGRSVTLATSRVARVRRRYRGRDTFEWLVSMGFMDQTVAQLPDPRMQFAPQPMISGLGRFGHTLSLQWLAARGARLVGRLEGVENGRLVLRDDLAANVRFGDEAALAVRRDIDKWLAGPGRGAGLEAGSIEADEADEPHPAPDSLHSPASLDLATEGISTVIWTTGVTGDYTWLPAGAVGPDDRPLHDGGVTPVPGVILLGLPWLRNRASGVVGGAGPDAVRAADLIAERLDGAAGAWPRWVRGTHPNESDSGA